MQIRPTAFSIGLIIYSFIALFAVYTEFGIDSSELLYVLFACIFKECPSHGDKVEYVDNAVLAEVAGLPVGKV